MLCNCESSPEIKDYLRTEVYKMQPAREPLVHGDANFRCSPTSSGILPQLLGDLTVKSFFEVTQAGSEFHFYRYRDGKGTFYESHADSVAYGLEHHKEIVRQHHQAKISNANLLRLCNAEPLKVGSADSVSTVCGSGSAK